MLPVGDDLFLDRGLEESGGFSRLYGGISDLRAIRVSLGARKGHSRQTVAKGAQRLVTTAAREGSMSAAVAQRHVTAVDLVDMDSAARIADAHGITSIDVLKIDTVHSDAC